MSDKVHNVNGYDLFQQSVVGEVVREHVRGPDGEWWTKVDFDTFDTSGAEVVIKSSGTNMILDSRVLIRMNGLNVSMASTTGADAAAHGADIKANINNVVPRYHCINQLIDTCIVEINETPEGYNTNNYLPALSRFNTNSESRKKYLGFGASQLDEANAYAKLPAS